ncbi:MAG: flippase-like domain-containing protein [Candidatus Omnitrophica bacterium]|nr:flippase-like domain-containing protein [Candidatus Omnitrophota bacterium]
MAIPKSFRKKLLISVGLGGIAFFVLALLPDRQEILEAGKTFAWRWMPIALGCALLNYVIRCVRWVWYLRILEIPVRLKESIPIFLIGLMLSATPGKAGELFKSYLLKVACGSRMSRTAPVVVVERLTDMTGMLILASTGLLVIDVRRELVYLLWAVIGVGLVVLSSKRLVHFFLDHTHALISERMIERLEHAYDSLSTLITLPRLLTATLMSAVAWFSECVSLMVILHGFGTVCTWIEATFIYSVSTLAGAALFFMPGGIGGTEAAMVSMLREIAGATEAVASLATVLTRAVTLWFAVIIGLVALFFCPFEIAEDVESEIEHAKDEL